MKQPPFSLWIIIAAFSLFSCAESHPEDYNEIESKALEVWIEANAPEAVPLGDTGIYYEVIEKEAETGKMDVRGKWVDASYLLRDLSGDIVYNRSEETARLLGTYSAYTHYVPERLYIASKRSASNIPAGLYEALTAIPRGETWRVYVPSRLSFGSVGFSSSNGYGGQKALEADVPVIIDSLRIEEIISDPQTYGREAIETLVTAPKPEGWEMMRGDTIRDGLYLDLFNRISEKDTIPVMQSANIYYKVRYLDGKLLYSNVDSVLYNNFGSVRSTDRTNAVRVTRMNAAPANAYQMPAKVFYAVLPYLCYGDIGRIAVPAEYAYNRNYMYPDMSESLWNSMTTFTYEDGYKYSEYTVEDTDYYFGASTYYRPLSSEIIHIGEVKPYTPLIYEFTVQRAE